MKQVATPLSLNTKTKPALRAVPMTLFPTMNSLEEVLSYAEAELPLCTYNQTYYLLMMYHNTLLKTGALN